MTPERQIRFWLIGLAVSLGALYLLSGILLPFVAGMAVAYFMDPLCDRLERIGLSRTVATTLVTVIFLLAVVLLTVLLLPALLHQILNLIEILPKLADAVHSRLSGVLALAETQLNFNLLEKLRSSLSANLGSLLDVAAVTVGNMARGGIAVVNLLSLIVLTPVVSFFLLRDWDKVMARLDRLLPRDHAPVIRQLGRESDEILAAYVRGVGLVCLMLGVFYAVGLTLVGLKSGLLIGLIAGLLSFVPFVGAIGGGALAIGMALFQFDSITPVVVVAAIFALGQIAEGNFLTPKLVGDKVGLHPVLVIFALLAGGTLFGFTGVLLALPIFAVIGVLVRFSLSRYLASPLYQGRAAPLPEPPAETLATETAAPARQETDN
jgi:predicted PurR-regulated permease PerM|tara:strand:+ start:408 stop:1541 length:1134 start_codon:yes stop_codon:yes gene_type:complete